MSHHLDTPLASQNGQLYIDDLYVFETNGSTVFVMDVNSTVTEPNVKPGFHAEARYEFRIHFDGSKYEELTTTYPSSHQHTRKMAFPVGRVRPAGEGGRPSASNGLGQGARGCSPRGRPIE